MILEVISALCMTLAMSSVVLLSGWRAFLTVIGFAGLAALIAWIAAKKHERSDI